MSGTLCTFSHPQMAVDVRNLQLYIGVLNDVETLQEFIDSISNNIENNRIKSHLHTFLQKTQEIDQFYNLANQHCSPRFEIQSGNDVWGAPFIFQYFIRKMHPYKHYCLYISVPQNHHLFGVSYEQVPDATFCGPDEEDPARWVFGWDYANANMLTLTSIYFYYAANPAALLDMQIISVDTIQEDVNQYVHILAG